MGIIERARDAWRPTNTLEAVVEPGRKLAKDLHSASPGASPAPVAAAPAAPPRPGQGGKPPAYTLEPATISKAYYVEEKDGERRYFDDYQRRALAMRATATSVSTKREDLNTVRAMLELADARGWQTVQIRGSAEFRREAWIEATARGLQGRGFAATDVERQEAERRRGEHRPVNEVRMPASASQAPVTSATQAPIKQAPANAAPAASQAEPAAPMLGDNRKAVREAQKELSPDGRLMLAALSEKIDRQMSRHHLETKAEMKAFVATELVKQERSQGPIVLSADQKRSAASLEPAPSRIPRPEPAPVNASRDEPQAPRRTLSR
jgi:hypothetical protein